MSFIEVIKKLEKIRNTKQDNYSNFDWSDYEFGKNFFECVQRDNSDTDIETKLIIEKLRLKKGSRILDLGCGGGRNAIELSKHGFEVIGIDLNKYAIEKAIENSKGFENVTFLEKNILDIQFNEEFDAVIMIFNHFSNFNKIEGKRLLQKIYKTLVKDGKLIIELPSISQGISLNGYQEWDILEYWLSGNFKQVVLSENKFITTSNIHVRNDYCIRLSDEKLFNFRQVSNLYTPEEINNLLNSCELKLINLFGNWEGKLFDESDEQLIFTAIK